MPRSRAERLLEALRRLEENHRVEIQASEQYDAWREERLAAGVSGHRVGGPPKPFTPPPAPEGVMNKTNHDSRMMRTEGQPTVQGYNAQAAVTRGQIIVAAEIAVESPDFGQLEPAVNAALRELEAAGVTQRPETVLADAGYWHKQQIERIVSDGIQVLVPPDGGLREDARPGWEQGMYAFMRPGARHRGRTRALQAAKSDRRASVRAGQVQPQDQPVPTTGPGRSIIGMAAGGRHAQPAEAPQPLDRRRNRLTRRNGGPPGPNARRGHTQRPTRENFARQPQRNAKATGRPLRETRV